MSEAYADGLSDVSSFDADGQLLIKTIAPTATPTAPKASFTYTYDSDGQVASETDTGMPGSEFVACGYDSEQRLTSAGSSSYVFDGSDDATTVDGAAGYAYDGSGQLTSTPAVAGRGAATYSYDASGDRRSMSVAGATPTSYSYNSAGELIGLSGATSAAYAYNGDGVRMSKTVNGATSQFAYDTTGSVPEILFDGVYSYVYGPSGDVVEQIATSGQVLYLHQDRLGSTRLISGSAGSTIGTFTYSPGGVLLASAGSNPSKFGFTGAYADSESGLLFLNARYYDPIAGSFISVDPLSDFTDESYSYASYDPVDATDPSGLLLGIPDPVTEFAGAVGGVVGGISGAVGYTAGVISGDQTFSVGGFVGATVGGAVGGAVAGACVEETDVINLGVCGALAGAASTAVNNLIAGRPVASGIGVGIAVGAVGNMIAGSAFPTNGAPPWKWRNLWNPGINAQRLYAQAGLQGLVGVFVTAAEATPGYGAVMSSSCETK